LARLKNILLREYVLVFLFCFAAIQGPAFSLMDNYNQDTDCIDCQTYRGLAQFNFDQSPVRRYRPVVPLLATGIYHTVGPVFRKLQPHNFPGDFPLSFSFLLVNSIMLSIWGVLIYRFCKDYGIGTCATLIGLLVMLTCRWTPYIAGTAIVDSFYCVTVTLALLGIVEKDNRFTAWAIFLGPFAKESFIFIAPIIFFFSSMPKGRQVVYFLLSGAMVFGFRYLYDHLSGFPPQSGLEADLYHFNYIKETVVKLFGFHGIYDLVSNPGLWLLAPVAAWWLVPGFKAALKQRLHWYMAAFMGSILIHMLLSGYFERMFYLAMPLMCMIVGLAVDEGKKHFSTTEK
jgi:hypothetical protein